MDTIKTTCPTCQKFLEFPPDCDNVICVVCGTAYRVLCFGGAISLSPIHPDSAWLERTDLDSGRLPAAEAMLADLDEEMLEVASAIEDLKSREQGAPLQVGCALFGLFGLVIVVLAFFVTVARSYFGSWLFYLALVTVVLLGLSSMRRKLMSWGQLEQLREERSELEKQLAQLEEERDRLLK